MAGTTSTLLLTAMTVSQAGLQIVSARREAKALEYNAKLEQQRIKALDISRDIELRKQAKEKRAFVARQKALVGKSGIALAGSPLTVINDTLYEFAMDAATTAFNYSIEKSQSVGRIEQLEMAASGTRAQGYMGAAGTIMKSAASIYGSKASGNMGGGGRSRFGNVYGSNTPSGVRDMGNYSRLPGK